MKLSRRGLIRGDFVRGALEHKKLDTSQTIEFLGESAIAFAIGYLAYRNLTQDKLEYKITSGAHLSAKEFPEALGFAPIFETLFSKVSNLYSQYKRAYTQEHCTSWTDDEGHTHKICTTSIDEPYGYTSDEVIKGWSDQLFGSLSRANGFNSEVFNLTNPSLEISSQPVNGLVESLISIPLYGLFAGAMVFYEEIADHLGYVDQDLHMNRRTFLKLLGMIPTAAFFISQQDALGIKNKGEYDRLADFTRDITSKMDVTHEGAVSLYFGTGVEGLRNLPTSILDEANRMAGVLENGGWFVDGGVKSAYAEVRNAATEAIKMFDAYFSRIAPGRYEVPEDFAVMSKNTWGTNAIKREESAVNTATYTSQVPIVLVATAFLATYLGAAEAVNQHI